MQPGPFTMLPYWMPASLIKQSSLTPLNSMPCLLAYAFLLHLNKTNPETQDYLRIKLKEEGRAILKAGMMRRRQQREICKGE